MQVKIKTQKIFAVENVLRQCANIQAAKLAYALARNANRVKEVTELVRDQLKGSDKLQEYRRAAEKAMQPGKDRDDLEGELEELKDTHDIRDEWETIQEKERELLDMETEIDWYEIPTAIIPGLGEEDNTGSGVLPLYAIQLLMEVGIIKEEKQEE